MAWDPSGVTPPGGTFYPVLPPPFPSPATFVSSGTRTEIDPKVPLIGILNATNFDAAHVAALSAYIGQTVSPIKSMSIAGGTVIASFSGMDLAQPYGSMPVGLAANMLAAPNQVYPVVGVPLPDSTDTSIYVTFSTPSNVIISAFTVKLGLCLDPNSGNADITGSKACFGASANPLISGTSTVDNSDLPPDVPTVTGALPTKVGAFYSFSMLANTTSIVEGTIHLLCVTRKAASSVLDNHAGRLLLVNLDIIAS